MTVSVCKKDKVTQAKIAKVSVYAGLKKTEVQEAKAGDIVEISGITDKELQLANKKLISVTFLVFHSEIPMTSDINLQS